MKLDYVKFIIDDLVVQGVTPVFDEGIRRFVRIELIELLTHQLKIDVLLRPGGTNDLARQLIDRAMTEAPRVRSYIDDVLARRHTEDARALYLDAQTNMLKLKLLRERLRYTSCPLNDELIDDLEKNGVKIDPGSRKQKFWTRMARCIKGERVIPIAELRQIGNMYHAACYMLMIKATDYRAALTRLLVYETHTRWGRERDRDIERSVIKTAENGDRESGALKEFRLRTHRTKFKLGRAEEHMFHARQKGRCLYGIRTGRLSDLDVLITP